jgi:hypothetical protein
MWNVTISQSGRFTWRLFHASAAANTAFHATRGGTWFPALAARRRTRAALQTLLLMYGPAPKVVLDCWACTKRQLLRHRHTDLCTSSMAGSHTRPSLQAAVYTCRGVFPRQSSSPGATLRAAMVPSWPLRVRPLAIRCYTARCALDRRFERFPASLPTCKCCPCPAMAFPAGGTITGVPIELPVPVVPQHDDLGGGVGQLGRVAGRVAPPTLFSGDSFVASRGACCCDD